MLVGNMYVIKFLKNSRPDYSGSEWNIPNFKNIFILDYFYLRDCLMKDTRTIYFEWIDEVTKNIPIIYSPEHP